MLKLVNRPATDNSATVTKATRRRLLWIAVLALGLTFAVLPLFSGTQAAKDPAIAAKSLLQSAGSGAGINAVHGNHDGQSPHSVAATITVNTLVDENNTGANCSLREAITAANTDAAFGGCPAGSGTDTISFSVTGTITLGSSLPDITSSMNITGPGASSLTISGNDSVRIMTINNVLTTTISNLTMAHGKALNLQGGAIDSNSNTVNLTNIVFDHNFATFDGGAVRNNGGNMTVTNCTFTNNEAVEPFGQGGGLKANGGTTVVTGSTFLNNIAEAGGGFHVGNSSASATVTNSTFYGNTATFGGAVETRNAGTFQNCTMSGNIASGVGGIHLLAGSVTLINTIVSGNLDPLGNPLDIDIGGTGTVNLAGSFNNLIGTPGGSGLTDGANGNHVNVTNPLLAPLANYGGPTQTIPPLGNSLAINAGRNTGAPATDQRGVARPVGGTVEIGAVEVNFIVNSNGDAVDSNIGNGTCATAGAVCTLRAAIQEVNASALDDYITFNLASPSTITLASSLPNITSSMAIAGTGAASLTVSGNDNVRIMTIDTGVTVAISNLTMAHGKALNLQGGAIDSSLNTVTLSGMVFDHNFATFDGGAVRNSSGNMTVSNCTFSNNVANPASGGGGGLRSNGTLVVTGSTFLTNSANGGGALQLGSGSTTTVTNSTFYGNTGVSGGAIETRGATTFQNCTINGNIESTGAGIRILLGSTTLINTIVSGNTDSIGNPRDLDGAINLGASFNNLIGSPGSSGMTDGVNGNHVNVTNPLLAPIANYGGTTQTMPPLANSVAIDAGKNVGAPATDQRGVARPSGASVEIGAVETSITVSPTSIPTGTLGAAYAGQTFSASGESGDFDFSKSGALPSGISFNNASANLSGTPTQTGSFPICVLATDTSSGHVGVACYTLAINAPVLDHFVIANITSPKTAGTAFNITITAQDSSNATMAGFTGTVNLSTNAGTISPTTSGTFISGVLTQSVSVTQSGTGKTISVDDGSGHTGTSNTFTVNPGPLHHFAIGAISTQTAGTAFNIGLTAQDINSNTVTSFTGTVGLSTTAGTISPTTSGAFASGTRTQSVTVTQAGASKTVSVDDGSGHTGTSNTFTVNPGALHHFAISNITAQTAGTAFNIGLTAQDLNSNTVTSFSGTVNLSTTAGTISPTTSGAFSSGARTESVTVTQAGASKTVSVDDGSGHTGTSNTFTVNPGALHHFAIGNISTQTAATAFNIGLTAQDLNSNTVTGFTGTVNLSTTAGTISPTISGLFTSGARTQSVTVTQVGAGKTVSVDDGSGHTGTSNSFTVNAGPLHHFAIGNISTQTAGAPFNIALTAQDLSSNTVTSFVGTVNLNTTAGTISPTTSSAFSIGARTESVTVTLAGAGKTISVDDGSGHTGTSNTFTVSNTYTWNGSINSNWSTAGNWTPSVVPSATSDIDIPSSGVTNDPALSAGVATVNNLNLATNRTLTLTQDLNLNGVLTLNGGNVNVGAGHTLVIGASGSVSRTAGQVFGTLKKTIGGPGSFTFPVGTANGYSPVDAVISAGSGNLTVEAKQGVQPALAGQSTTALQRYWSLSGAGVTVNLTFNYLVGDVMGTEATYRVLRVSGGAPIVWPGSAADTVNHTATASGVSSFSDWTLATPSVPTAAAASISGQITTGDGHPLGGVVVELSGQGAAQTGTHRRAITDTNGFYHFDNVESEAFYTVTPQLVNYRFGPASRSFSLLANKTDAVFTANADAVPSANPLDTNEYFVRQQYLDFLGREPDQDGLDYWSAQLYACDTDTQCIRQRRIDVSAAFFASREFQQTGSFVYRLYQASYGAQPSYAQFTNDRNKIVGGPNLEESKTAFANEWTTRAEFTAAYPSTLGNSAFVLKLFGNAGLLGQTEEQQQQISALDNGASRAQVLRAVIEIKALLDREYNPSFVLMQYFGYLHRDADQGGYNFWLNVLNTSANSGGGDTPNYRGMVCSFITATEYQQRFSPVVTHINADCGE